MVSFYLWLVNALLIKCEVDRILGPQKRHDETSLRPFPGSDLLSRQAEKGFGMEGWQPQWAGPDWESRFCKAFC